MISGAFGEMVVPFFIGIMMDWFGPFTLFTAYLGCVIILVLIYMRISKFKDTAIIVMETPGIELVE